MAAADIEALADKYVDELVKNDLDHKEFLPHNIPSKIITQDAILGEFQEIVTSPISQDLVRFIHHHAKVVFLLTISINLVGQDLYNAMELFQSQNFADGCLPVSKMCTDPEYGAVFSHRMWTKMRKKSFSDNQWWFIAPVFTKDKFAYSFQLDCILPFKWTNKIIKEGAFSRVFQIEIHPYHHEQRFTFKGACASVALKEIRAREPSESQAVQNAFDSEAKALDSISKLNHDHLIQWIAAFTRGDQHYFMFEWADGGSLREFWENTPRPSLDIGTMSTLVLETLEQVQGLADGLHTLHVKGFYRHGDLKPENILRFEDGTRLGRLKIADFGLAKEHKVLTERRRQPTSTIHGTVRYESPEATRALVVGKEPLSRLSDIWSMGCILLEHIIWLLYEYSELDRFNTEMKINTMDSPPFYRQNEVTGRVEVQPRVASWMRHMLQDPECANQPTSIGDLIALIRDKLLVVNLPRSWTALQEQAQQMDVPGRPRERASASTMKIKMNEILAKARNPTNAGYLFTGTRRIGLKGPNPPQPHGTTRQPRIVDPQMEVDPEDRLTTHAPRGPISGDARPPMPDVDDTPPEPIAVPVPPQMQTMSSQWKFQVDNVFASTVLEKVGKETMYPPSIPPATVCDRCRDLSFTMWGFTFNDTLDNLKAKSESCDLCRLLWQACQKYKDKVDLTSIRFERYVSTLKLVDDNVSHPLVSIIRSPFGPKESSHSPLQMGFPSLSEPGSNVHFEIVRQWLEACDETHEECLPKRVWSVPKRLIDVGDETSSTLRLFDTEPGAKYRYIALSHPWGQPPHFCTWPDDPDNPDAEHTVSRHKAGFAHSDLPATFFDAVRTTRALGVRYLWIDSVCIIQGAKGDFKEQVSRMEDVFSGAYCVVAASWAAGQADGFLKNGAHQAGLRAKRSRGVVKLQRESPLYVCEMVDDFGKHVLEGHLNSRGWVLQERALARRSVFFTERQTYWECGRGVMCETMTKMENDVAARLGDSSFPERTLTGTDVEKTKSFQEIYAQYSRLAFTRIEDRPLGIRGLETRLIRGFPSQKGGHGIFCDDGFLHQSLLWRRGHDEKTMERIHFPDGGGAPTWSWMAYKGGISYVDPAEDLKEYTSFDSVVWETERLSTPWSRGADDTVVAEKGASAKGGDFAVPPSAVDDRDFAQQPQPKRVKFPTNSHPSRGEDWDISAVARDFRTDHSGNGNGDGGGSPTWNIVYDVPGMSDRPGLKCVVVGWEMLTKDVRDKTHYVLIVAPGRSGLGRGTSVGAGGGKVYERVGVGVMPGRCVDLEGEGLDILIY